MSNTKPSPNVNRYCIIIEESRRPDGGTEIDVVLSTDAPKQGIGHDMQQACVRFLTEIAGRAGGEIHQAKNVPTYPNN